MLRPENTLETTKFRPIESEEDQTVENHNNEDASEELETTREIILQMNTRERPSEETYSDNIFPKYRPTETRSKFACLTERKTPDKYPTYTTCKC